MADSRYLAVAAIIVVFMLVTVGHVAHYAGSFEDGGWTFLGWPYAIGVDAAIVVCAWLTRWKSTRVFAWVGYFAFVAASGAMNAAAIKPWLQPWPEWLFAWVYSLFPTAAIGLLGFLAGAAEVVAERSHKRGALAAIVSRISVRMAQPAPLSAPLSAPLGRRANMTDVSAIVASMNGNRAQLTTSELRGLLAGQGFDESPESTLRHWVKLAQGGKL